MQKAAGLAGGVRFGPDGNEVIPASPDVADMTEDDVMLMTVSEGIPSGSIKPPCVCCLHSSPTWLRSLQAGKARG
nr:phage tail assembly protein T [Escherichia coli]